MDETMCFGKLIGVLSNEIKRCFNFDLDTEKLTQKQKRILHFIFARDRLENVYQKEIEREFNLRRSSASELLAHLEQEGYIKRESVDFDARLKRIAITEKAENIRNQVIKDCCEMENRLVEGIAEEELKICNSVLEKMLYNLKEDQYA
jgi:DNA-binding MarR family transcriptional regulator